METSRRLKCRAPSSLPNWFLAKTIGVNPPGAESLKMNREKIELAIERLEKLADGLKEFQSLGDNVNIDIVRKELPEIIADLHEALLTPQSFQTAVTVVSG